MLLTRYSSPRLRALGSLGACDTIQHDINQLFGLGSDGERSWSPPLEVVEAKDRFVVTLELPGVAAASVKVSLEDDILTISGERAFSAGEGAEVRFSERAYGRFERSVRLPAPVQTDQVSANSKDGILTVSLPKTEDAKPRDIKVTVA